MKKSDLPLLVWQQLEKFVPLHGDKFEVKSSGQTESRLYLKGTGLLSGCFFIIDKLTANGTKTYAHITQKPKNIVSSKTIQFKIDCNELSGVFDKWVMLLESIYSINTFLDDPIVAAYADEFIFGVEIHEPDKPLKYSDALLLDEKISGLVAELEKEKNLESGDDIDEIIAEALEVKNNLTKKAKAKVLKDIALIFGKLAKSGPKYISIFLTQITKELAKQAAQGLLS